MVVLLNRKWSQTLVSRNGSSNHTWDNLGQPSLRVLNESSRVRMAVQASLGAIKACRRLDYQNKK